MIDNDVLPVLMIMRTVLTFKAIMETDDKAVIAAAESVAETNCPHCRDMIDVSGLEPFTHAECPHCGETLTVPCRLGTFLLLDVIGTGGMGGVYRARDESLGRLVAIKVMLASLGEDQEFVENFRREAQAAAKLNHPHIAQIYSFGQEKGHPYIAMELVPGRGLDKLIESGKTLDQALVLQIGLDIAEGLREAGEIGLVHGDIKPENILLDEKMSAKLVDFGVASFVGQTGADGIWGTPYYIAPEKIKSQKADARSDIYCLGATLYHALAGQPPFDGETPIEVVKARLEREPVPLRQVRQDIHEQVEQIIARMTRTEPIERYPTYASLISDMRKVMHVLNPKGIRTAKSKKIRIRGKPGVSIAPGTPASPTDSFTTVPAGDEPSEEPRELAEKQKARRKSALKAVMWVFVGILVLLGVFGGLFYLKVRHDRTINARREYLALTAARNKGQGTLAEIRSTTSNIVKRAAATVALVTEITNTVAAVTFGSAGDLLEILKPKSEAQAVPPPAPAEEQDKQAELEQAHATAEAGAEEEAAATAPGEAAETGEVESGQSQAPPEPEAEEAPPPPARPQPPEDEHEIRLMARKALSHVAHIRSAAVDARATQAEATQAWQQAMPVSRAAFVAEKATLLDHMLESLMRRESGVEKAMERAVSTVDAMVAMRAQIQEALAASERARLEAERRKQEELERQRRAQEYAARVETELEAAGGIREANELLLKQHAYDQVVRTLKRQQDDMQTKEGREALQLFIDRYSRLEQLKLFLVKQLTDHQFKWGWIQGRTVEDILGATPRHIQLQDRLVPWQDVQTKQMMHMIRKYVTRSNQDVPLRVLAGHTLGAAVFCFENGGMDPAAAFADEAVQMSKRLQDEVRRLVPLDQEYDE